MYHTPTRHSGHGIPGRGGPYHVPTQDWQYGQGREHHSAHQPEHSEGYLRPHQHGAPVHHHQKHDQGGSEIDRLVQSHKNLRDANFIGNWVDQVTRIMERYKIEPIPITVPSEAGSDLSQADTILAQQIYHEFEKRDRGGSGLPTPPDSPPWRRQNEGGIVSEESMQTGFQQHLMQPLHLAVPASFLEEYPEETTRHHIFPIPDENEPYQKNHGHSAQKPKPPIHGQFEKQSADDASTGRAAGFTSPPRVARPTPAPPATPAAPSVEAKQITLGITFGKSSDDQPRGLPVVRIKDGGVTQLHGAIEIGDVVVSIDDSPLDGLTAVAVNRLLVGAESSVAKLIVIKKGTTEETQMDIARVLATTSGGGAPYARTSFGVVRK